MNPRQEKAKKKREERMMAKVNEDLLTNTLEDTAELIEEKPQTLSDMIAPLRENIKQEKTDAVKMQKYYALTDALGALGKMGGAAIGGAIGGNVMDSAPVVGEYQPSRGYVAAFEKAKNANDKLRALDEKEFQLTYNQKLKQADMDWQKELAEYNAQQKRQMTADANEYNRQLQREVSMRNFLQKQKLAEIEAQNVINLQRERNAGSIAEKEIGKQISDEQFERYNTELIAFKDGTSVSLPKNYYNAVANFFIDDDYITEKNVARYMRDNPALVRKVLEQLGYKTSSSAPKTQKQTSMMPNGFYGGLWNPQQGGGNYVEMTPEQAKQTTGSKSKNQTTEIPDIYQFVEKK
jgi:hypothetical protein